MASFTVTYTTEPASTEDAKRVRMSNIVDRIAIYLASIKFPDTEWCDLKTSTTQTFRRIATDLITEIEGELRRNPA